MSPTTQTVEYIVRADAPAQLEPNDPRTPALADVSRSDVVLFETGTSSTDSRQRLELETAILTMSLDRSIDGASVFKATVLDQDGTLIQHPLFRRSSDGLFYARTVLDTLVFHLVGVGVPSPRRVELTFEEQPYNALRRHDKPLHGSRGKYTRAQFIKRMCDEASVELVSPELSVKQKIAKEKLTPAQKNTSREPGISDHAHLTVKGQPMTANQRKEAETALSVARSLGAGALPTLAMICAAIGESTLGDEPGTYRPNGAGYWGVFQAGSGAGQSVRNFPDPHDTAGMARSFLKGGKGFQAGGAIALSRTVKDPGEIATRVEASGEPGAFYGVYKDEAQKIIDAFTGGSSNSLGVLSNDADQYTVAYEFSRGQNGQKEDSITCIRRLADEVAWYFFVSAGKAYYASGEYLARSRARMLVEPHGEGIEGVAFQLDESDKYQDQIVVTCRAARWQAPPGSVAEVSGYGPADGRWLIGSINRPKMAASNVTQITLVRAKHKKAEPAHETRQTSSTSSSNVEVTGAVDATGISVSGGTIRERVLSIAKKAAQISSNDPNYYRYSKMGAWKNDVFERDSASDRSDCSSFVIQVYAKALGGYENLPAALRHQGFTGSLADVGHKTSTPHVGDICLYGSYPYHHVELYVGDGHTIGHGSPPVDAGTPHMMSDFAGYWTFDFLDEPSAVSQHPRT